MSVEAMSHDTIQTDHIPSEENLPVANQQDERKSKEIGSGIRQAKKIPMTPTRLEYSWWSTHPREIAVIASVLFIITIIVPGTMIVCLTQLIPTGKKCGPVLISFARSSMINDSRPHSTAVGDFNNDGFPDIVVTNSGMNNIGVFLRHANGTFTDQIIYSTGPGSTPYAVAVVDFNHDGHLDIAVANFGSHNIVIFLGTGNGTFTPQTTFFTGSSRPRSIAIGDFNNDKQLDIVVVNYGTSDVGIFLQDTNGTFANQITFSTGYDSNPYSLAVGDLNNDHKLDIVVANYDTNNVGVFLGRGNGTFAIQIIFSTDVDSHPSSIDVGDLNNDTYLDIVIACPGTNNVSVLLGYGNGTFTMPTEYFTGNNSSPRSVAIADFDNDNKLDIAVAKYGNDSIVILLGDGNGYFSDRNITFFSSSNLNPYLIAIGDFNSDTRSDIVIVNYDFNHVDIILNYKNYYLSSQTTYPTYEDTCPISVVIADLDNDSYGDIIVANFRNSAISIFLGPENGSNLYKITYLFPNDFGTCSIVVGDFNNDNLPDIVFTNCLDDSIGVLLGYGKSSFSIKTFFFTGYGSFPKSVALGDFNNDSQLDLVVANYGNDNLGIYLGYGDGTFFSQVIYSTGNGSRPNSVAIGDFNNDSQLDIVVANSGSSNVGILLGHGDGTFSDQTTYFTDYDSCPSSVAVGDFNNDNRTDIVVANSATNTIGLFVGYGNSTFSNQITFSTGSGSGPYSVTIGDFNNDSQLDVAVGNRLADNLGIFIGYGNGSFSNQTTYSTGSGSKPIAVATGDLNDDGSSDIAVANYGASNIGIFIQSSNADFNTQQTIFTASRAKPISVAVGDFNDDNLLDITVVNYLINTLCIFFGYGNGSFSSQTIYIIDFGASSTSIAVGDFNNDNQLDIVIANGGFYNINGSANIGVLLGYGNGTFSHGVTFSTGYNPDTSAVTVGDFNNDDRLDIAVANSATDNIGIFLGYGDGTFVSQVTYSTGSFSVPCSVTTGDFNNDGRLDIVVTNNRADNIGVFLGYGNGTFSNQTTYSTPTGAASVDAVVGDLNNDGKLDIVVVLNSAEGIIVFLGNGDGTFSRQLIYFTGSQSVPNSCALGDINNDGRMDVVVSDIHHSRIVALLGDGEGGFSNTTMHSTGTDSDAESIAFGDFNNDGILDIVVANNNSDTIGVFLGSTYIAGERENICSTGSSAHPRAIALGDLNKNTHLDVIMANYGLDNVEALLDDTNRAFSMQIIFSTGALSLPTSVAVGDFNGDSDLDITVANSGTANIGILYGHGNGSFMNQMTFPTGLDSTPQSVAVGDFNSDQRLDIVVTDSGTERVLTLLRYDIGTFGNKAVYSTGTNSYPWSVAVGDLNNDGWLDFAVINADSDTLGVFLGLGNGTFSNQTTYSTGSYSFPRCIAVADINNDNHLDIIVSNYGSDTLGMFFGFGNGSFSNPVTYPTGNWSGPSGIALGDFNNDGRLDIVVANYWDGNVRIFLGYDNDTFSSVVTYSTGSDSGPESIAVGDFNNDDQLDFVVVNFNNENLAVFIANGNGTFYSPVAYSTGNGSATVSVVVDDLNKDDQLDIIVANSGTDNIGVLFGRGDGTFSNQTTYPTGSGSNPYFVAIGDLNNDNQLDIAIANWGSNSFSVLLGCVNGTFFSPLNYIIAGGSHPYSIAIGDFNNDNRLDIIVSNSGNENVGVFFGYVSESFLNAPSYSTGPFSRPISIAVGDFDKDTRLDVVVANNGMSNVMILFGSGYGTFENKITYSTGNDSHPCWVTVGDLNNDNRLDIVVANSGTSNIGIFLSNGSGTFSNQVTHSTGIDSQPYSVAVLDFNNDTHLDIAVANYGSNNVGVFYGDGNGGFSNQLTFDTGFGSHPFAIAVGDINNDNLTDIIATNDGDGNIDILFVEC